MRIREAGDEAIGESYECMDLSPVDDPLVDFFSSKLPYSSLFLLFYACFCG